LSEGPADPPCIGIIAWQAQTGDNEATDRRFNDTGTEGSRNYFSL